MMILAVETSCDDTAVALLDGCTPLQERVRSQEEVHAAHGGVVPELASRDHLRVLPSLVDSVLGSAGLGSPGDVDVLAATAGPGLVGSLLVGLSWTKAAAWASGARFIAVNHLAAHLHIHYGCGLEVSFPAVALLVSGGHTCILRMNAWNDIHLLGTTRDDAAGEAFDKTAKLAGLGYPGGAELDRLADTGDPEAVSLPSPMADPSLPEFSFSGLKTAARSALEGGARPCDLAASFRRTVVDLLVGKLMHQCDLMRAESVLAAGGVTANSLLRESLRSECRKRGMPLFLPDREHAVDNALMVGRSAAAVLDEDPDASSSLSCNAFARWRGPRLETLCCR